MSHYSEVSEVIEDSPSQDLINAHASFLAVLEHNKSFQHHNPSQDFEHFIPLDRAIFKFLSDSFSEESDLDEDTDTKKLRSLSAYIQTKKTLNQFHVKKSVDFDTWLQMLQKMGLSESAAMLDLKKAKKILNKGERLSVMQLRFQQPVTKLTHKVNNKVVGRVLNSDDGSVKTFTKSSQNDKVLDDMKKEKGNVLKRAKKYFEGAIRNFIRVPAVDSTSLERLRAGSLVSSKLVRKSGGVVLRAANNSEKISCDDENTDI